jgi:superfamily II DNA/RNA helicase
MIGNKRKAKDSSENKLEPKSKEQKVENVEEEQNLLFSNGFDDFGLKEIDWASKTLDPFQKDLYREHTCVKDMSHKSVNEFREKNEIRVFGGNDENAVPNPITQFEYAAGNFPNSVMKTIKVLKFVNPTPIQAQAWPIILKGYDMVGLAETGSGKTLAFILPALTHLLEQRPVARGEGPIVLILSPTRELAVQIQQECDKYGVNAYELQKTDEANSAKIEIKNACLYGGEAKRSQIKQLKQCPQIVIATPGRLLDFISAKVTNLKRVTYLVLDEADRMLDMGFLPQIKQIISQIRPDRQTVMFSATWSANVQELASQYMSEPYIVNIGSVGMAANRNVKQEFLFIQESDKIARLLKLLDQIMDGSRVLIFCMTKHTTDYVTQKLREEGWPALSIHGSRNQQEREWVINEFKSGETPLMVATDVAARGLDIDDIKIVINFDMPKEIETYVHRIGRTGRAQKKGKAISFFTPDNIYLCKELIRVLKQSKHEIPEQLLKLKKIIKKQHD